MWFGVSGGWLDIFSFRGRVRTEMLKILSSFLLLASVLGQNEPIDKETVESILTDIFASKPPNLSAVTKTDSEEKKISSPQSCTRDDGRKGICASYYLCVKNFTIVTDGSLLMDRRGIKSTPSKRTKRSASESCSSYVHECCIEPVMTSVERNKSRSDVPLIPKPGVSKGEGCGWGNPDGVSVVLSPAEAGKAKFGEFPWTCAILTIDYALPNDPSSKFNKYVGGASLIHRSVVLTSASVVQGADKEDLLVRAGEWDTQGETEIYPHQDRKVASFVVHEGFNYDSLINDIAVIFLASPVDFAPNVAPVCLPPAGFVTPEPTRCFGTGWGKNRFGTKGRYQVLQKKVEVPVVEEEKCENQLRKTRLSEYFQLDSSFMCAGGEEGQDMCTGDGGAPLSCPVQGHPDRFVQSGIVSWSIGCQQQGVPGVYADVAKFRPWIDEKVINQGYNPEEYTI